jgi:hypothetical protein
LVMPILHFWGATVDLTGSLERIGPVSLCVCRSFPRCGRGQAVYAVTNLWRKAYKFARPISTITWAVFLASPR